MSEWRAYHDVPSSEHQRWFDELSSEGFRLISLSVYGELPILLYAAVWVRRAGPALVGFHDLSERDYRRLHGQQSALGFHPVILCATGRDPASARFAGVFEADTAGFDSMHDATELQIQSRPEDHAKFSMRWLSAYGDPEHPRYAAVWEPAAGRPGWSIEFHDDAQTYQHKFDAYAAGHMRPACVSVVGGATPGSPQQTVRYASLWHDDFIGGWFAFHGLRSSEYQHKVDELAAQGFMPIRVQAGAPSDGYRFAAIFARDDVAPRRFWDVRDAGTLGLQSLDAVMRTFMEDNRIRAGQLAVVRRGRLVYARAFTHAEGDYPLTETTTRFRIASISKPITATAAYVLIEQGKLDVNEPIQKILQLRTPDGGATQADFNSVSVWHLLAHASGLDDEDQSKRSEKVVATAFNILLPITREHLARFTAGRPLFSTPGRPWHYNSIAYFMLGQVLSKRAGVDYDQFVFDNVFAPLGAARARVSRTLLQVSSDGEVRYEPKEPGIGESVLHPDRPWVSKPYGTWDVGLGAAMGGWAMAAVDYARFLASFDLGGNNPVLRPDTVEAMWTSPPVMQDSQVLNGWWRKEVDAKLEGIGHNGGLAGTTSVAWRRFDGVSVVALFNRDVNADWFRNCPFGHDMNVAISGITQWPSVDLFPNVGLTSMCDDEWARCERCQVLFHRADSSTNCAAGPGGHRAAADIYTLVRNLPAARGEKGWRRCASCEVLWFNGDGGNGPCRVSASGVHEASPTDYALVRTPSPRDPGQPGWRICSACRSLWYALGGTQGACAGSASGHAPASGSPQYSLLRN